MTSVQFLLYFFSFTAVAAAVGVLLSRHLLNAALFLLASLLSVAALFIISGAEYVAVTQIIIYAGGTTMLILFGIMLTTPLAGKPLQISNGRIFSCIILSSLLIGMLTKAILSLKLNPATEVVGPLRDVGSSLITDHSFPFELAGILLLVALIASTVMISAGNERRTPND